MKYGPVNIYYASHTGTAENFAEDLKEEGAQKGIWCETINVKNFEVILGFLYGKMLLTVVGKCLFQEQNEHFRDCNSLRR